MTTRVGEVSTQKMRATVKRLRVVAVVCAVTLIAAACSGETAESTTMATTTPDPTTTTTLPPDPALDGPVLRVGVTNDITTANWWAAMDVSSTPENQTMLANTKESLFTLTRPGFVLVPSVAATAQPSPVTQQGSVWAVEQELRDDVYWSDGEQVTAADLVFYFDIVREFNLAGAHGAHFPAIVTDVSAGDDLIVRVEFSGDPTLTDWVTGVAMAPLVPSHFWQSQVDRARAAAESARASTSDEEARAAVAAASLVDADPDNDLSPEEVTGSQIETHKADVAAEAGRDYLYAVESPREPSSGPLIFDSWEDGVAVTRSNPDFYARGTETTIYSNGSVRISSPTSGEETYQGDSSGAVEAHHVVGPFVSGIEWREFESETDAYGALSAGEIDFVLQPDGMTFSQYNDLATQHDVGLSISQADGFRFLAFNLRKPPMSDPVFRNAVATVIDKELIASSLYNGTLHPAYAVVHPGLTTFHNPDVNRPGWSNGEPMSKGERYQAAIAMLTEAGYTWDVEPEIVYDSNASFTDIVPGSGLEMPNGVDVPELRILAAPGPEEDPMRATVALWIEQWMTDLGIEVDTETTDLASIADETMEPTSLEDTLSWDLHVLGWGAPNPALPGTTLAALFHSQNGVETGGLNTTGYASATFDVAADAFVAARTIEEAAEWTKEMDRIIAEDLPYITLYRDSVVEAFGSHVEFPVDAIMGGHAVAPSAWPASVRIND